MASLGQAKILGGIGSILTLVGIAPLGYFGGTIISIIGWILIIIAVKQVADALAEPKIFNDMLIAVVLSIIGVVVIGVVVAATLFQFIGLGQSITPGTTTVPSDFFALLATLLVGLLIAWVVFLVGSIFIRRSYDAIKLRTNIGIFGTTGLLFLIGAATTIIFVGFIIILIADILQAIAFFSLPDQYTPQTYQPGGPMQPGPPMPPPQ